MSSVTKLKNKLWHNLGVEQVLELLGADVTNGLSPEEVHHRQKEFGPNQVTARRGTPVWLKFLQQFHSPLLYILLLAAGVAAYLGEWVDAAVIFGVVLVNAIVGYIQESKAERAIEALSRLVKTDATVRRGGQKQRVPAVDLVPGDIVLLQSGDKVPADMRLLHVRSLRVDESALTGESVPVEKHARALGTDAIMAERKNLAYAGTLVTYGYAEAVVWGIGNDTETGRIARLITEADVLATPLTRKIAQFSKVLLVVIVALAALTFAVGLVRGQAPADVFMAAIALAVGAIPEGLPAAVTVTLAIGVVRMAKRRAIIRKLPAVETLGSTTVICSDKTGTLTENQMTVQEVFAAGTFYTLTGAGYEAKGELWLDTERASASQSAALAETLRAGFLCNDSQLVRQGDRLIVQGDPTEAALLVAAQKAGLGEPTARIDMIPFESEHMFRGTLHEGGKRRVIYKVGALERILERCTDALDQEGNLVALEKEVVHRAVERMAGKGLRVLAFARRHVAPEHQTLDHKDVATGLTFLGLQGMIDPPRAEVIQAVRRCRDAGIAVKMITGDHLVTARAIAEQIGLSPVALSGRQLEKLGDDELPAVADRTSVFARVAPEQKFRLVKALQARGHVVAMTGDGVNDAPALKQADIGIAMGITGTDVAKGAADMILTDDNFASIEAAVEEGRGVYENLKKFIVWTLPTNGGEALVLLAALAVGSALPALPVHFLWVNMTTAILLGLTLVFEPKERTLMFRPPRHPKAPILNYPLIMRTGFVSLITLAGAFGLFTWEQRVNAASLPEARTIVVNVIVMVEIFYLLNCRSLLHSVRSVGVFSNPWIFVGIASMLAAQMLFTYAPFMNRLFHTAPITADAWARIVGVGVIAFLAVEFEKWLRVKSGEERKLSGT